MVSKLDDLFIRAKTWLYYFRQDEAGDTNFISILVLLGIALALAGVFLGFKNQVLDWVNRNIGDFFSTTVGGSSGGGIR